MESSVTLAAIAAALAARIASADGKAPSFRCRRMVGNSSAIILKSVGARIDPCADAVVQMLWSIATMRTFFASNTRVQLATVSNSALVGLTPARLELVNFTPRG